MMAWLQAAGVLCGGAAGAACRFALGLTLANGWLPWGILTANVLGCLLRGVLQGVMRRPQPFSGRRGRGRGLWAGYALPPPCLNGRLFPERRPIRACFRLPVPAPDSVVSL